MYLSGAPAACALSSLLTGRLERDSMDGTRFDQLVRTVAVSGSRRRLLGALLAGALGSLRLRTTAADDSGTAIADASGGNDNLASAVDQASSGQDHNHDRDSN